MRAAVREVRAGHCFRKDVGTLLNTKSVGRVIQDGLNFRSVRPQEARDCFVGS